MAIIIKKLPQNIRIHKSLLTKLSQDNKWLKAMSVFYSLKYMYSGGIILNITKRYSEIAKFLGISETNLRSKINFLIEKGLIEKNNNKLIFISFNTIQKKFKIKTFKSYRIEYDKPKELEIKLKLIILEENLKRQEYKLQEKIINEELKKFGKIEAKTTIKKIRKKIKSNINYLTEQYKQRELDYSLTNNYSSKNINSEITLSRNSIAKQFGRTHKSAGSRFIKKLKTKGLVVEDIKRIKLVSKNFKNNNIKKSLELDSSYFIYKSNLFQRKSNKVSFINIIA